MTKNELRKKMLEKRLITQHNTIIVKSNKIFNNFQKNIFPKLKKGDIIVYNSFKNEVKTDKIISFLIKKGFKIFSPCVEEKKIIPVRFLSSKKLTPGPYSIPEPPKKYKLKSYKNIKAIIIPGIAFDKKGNRLGFGKGYFDRFLASINKNVIKIGLAFSFQVLEKIPSTKNDIKMDIIITDKEIIYVNKKKKNL